MEADISATAAASRAASAITRALQADAEKRLKAIETECAHYEAKVARLKAEGALLGSTPTNPGIPKVEFDSSAEKAAITDAKEKLAKERAALVAERATFQAQAEEGQAKLKAETKALADLRAQLDAIRAEIEASVKVRAADDHRTEAALEAERLKMEELRAALADRERMFEEQQRKLQENMKNLAKA
jgi:fibrillary acidic protein/desmin